MSLKKPTIEEFQKIAKKKGGKCLSKTYVNSYTKLKWQCKKGHEWQNTPTHIKRGQWCPICGHAETANKLRSNIEEMKKLAAKRGGKCLSARYINTSTKLKWQCKNGHQWQARPDGIKQGQWCPVCAVNKRKSKRK